MRGLYIANNILRAPMRHRGTTARVLNTNGKQRIIPSASQRIKLYVRLTGLNAPRISPSSFKPKQSPALSATSFPRSSSTCWRKFPRNPVAKTITSALISVPSENLKPFSVYATAAASDLILIYEKSSRLVPVPWQPP